MQWAVSRLFNYGRSLSTSEATKTIVVAGAATSIGTSVVERGCEVYALYVADVGPQTGIHTTATAAIL